MGKRLAVIFPGIGYHCDKPILYYSRKLAKEQEYKEIISLEYSYTEKNNTFSYFEKSIVSNSFSAC